MTTGVLPSLGELLRRFRSRAVLTQEALAERAALSARTVRSIESGAQRSARQETVRLLAGALNLSAQETASFIAAARPRAALPPELDAPTYGDVPPLAGRGEELALLERHLAGAEPPVLLLAGEPGIGKSRLLQEATRIAVVYGWTMLYGGCQRRDGQEPYAPLLEALDHYLHRLAPGRQAAALRGCSSLVRLLPDLAALPIEPLPSWTLTPEQERRLMYGAVARLLANIAGTGGTLLLLDDLQWAGRDALDLLAALVRSIPESPLRIVGAYRDTEVPARSPLSVLLADLARARLVTHHALAPLSTDEAGHLFDGVLRNSSEAGPAPRAEIVRRTGGVPFFIVSYAQGLQAGRHPDAGTRAVPWDVAQGLRQRVEELPEPARLALGVAAVVGRRAPRSVLVAASEQPEATMLEALEATCRARLLVEEDDAATYAFAHDVIRETVEAGLSGARRIALHRRVAMALERQPGEPPVELLAYHYSHGDTAEKAILYLEQAGDQARARAAPAAAHDHFQELARRLESLNRPQDEARAREKLGIILYELAQYDEAIAALSRAAELFRHAGDLSSVGRATAQMSYVYTDSGRPEQGERSVRDLLEPLEASGAWQGLVALYPALAWYHFMSGRYRDQLAVAERAEKLARRVGIDKYVGDAIHNRAGALLLLGRFEESVPLLRETYRLGEQCGDLGMQSSALTNLATATMYMGEFEQSLRYSEQAIAAARRRGEPTLLSLCILKRTIVALFNGDWKQSRADLEELMAMREQISAGWGFSYVLLTKGTLHLLEGDWGTAMPYLEDAIVLATRINDLEALRWTHSRLAELDILEGRPAAARDRITPLLDRPGMEDADVIILLPRLAWAYLELSELDAAAATVSRGVARARAATHRIALVDSLWIQGMVHARQKLWTEAAQALAEGLELARRLPYPYAEARLLETDATLHAMRDDAAAAREHREAALAIFTRLGARKDAERIARVH